jgi:hypothetical protein
MIDEIMGRSYSDWLGSVDLAAVYADRNHLLKMVDALAERCAYLSGDSAESYINVADAQARVEG